jgi:hypothetical protein
MTDKLDQQTENSTPAEQQVSEQKISSQKDALADGSLDNVSGGGWPYATMNTQQVTPTI